MVEILSEERLACLSDSKIWKVFFCSVLKVAGEGGVSQANYFRISEGEGQI